MPTGPILGLLYAFLLLNSNSPILSLGLYYAVSGFLGSFHCFQAPLSHFFLLGILGPFHHFRAPLSHFILLDILRLFHRFQASLSHSGSFVPFYSFGHPRPILILYTPNPKGFEAWERHLKVPVDFFFFLSFLTIQSTKLYQVLISRIIIIIPLNIFSE